jgi:hypothetical protein
MSKRFPSVNSRKLSELIGTNERAQRAAKALDFAQRRNGAPTRTIAKDAGVQALDAAASVHEKKLI